MAGAAGVAIKAAAVKINKDRAPIGAAAAKVKEDGTITKVHAGNPTNGNPRPLEPRRMASYPRQRLSSPLWTGLSDPANPLYGVGQIRNPSPQLTDQNPKRSQPTSHLGLQMK